MAMATQQVTIVQGTQWKTGVCSCFDDMEICCCAFWCFPCFQCKTVRDFGECLCLPLLEYHLPGCQVSTAMRAAVRERNGIQGSICNDCCTLCCCYTCTWCQMAREIKHRRNPMSMVTVQTTTVQPQHYPYR
ncbi:placenta-specific gene 8 protein [Xenopus laevis]|uniref:Placenta-specific gene 8 protein n=1 Tax=Xenopus laevis TaxID=8355 RepID=A0A8J0U2I4_XENLA|nr:placenta-specific gene 8 protein [Xenopus laevis]OCT59620.1 hypothetical protein XELAEV_18001042mg [Xenopus laevis]